jgi:hypothetical protein
VPTASDGKSYLQQTNSGPDLRFSTGAIPISAIAASTGQNDAGVFSVDFKDERYMPFEGAGAISTWQLDLPPAFRQFDYSSITDVIITMRYTSWDGGMQLQSAASSAVSNFLKDTTDSTAGFLALFDIKNEFALEYARAASNPPASSGTTTSAGPRVMALTNLAARLPFFTKTADPKKIIARNITLVTENPSLPGTAFTLSVSGTAAAASSPVTFGATPTSTVGDLQMFAQNGVNLVISDWSLSVDLSQLPAGTTLGVLFLVVQYTIG